jgi:FAD/FMN-containing dehydrogenase
VSGKKSRISAIPQASFIKPFGPTLALTSVSRSASSAFSSRSARDAWWRSGRTFNLVIFGHVADSNIHICVRVESAATQPEKAVDEIVYRCVSEFSGSISAEHGIGLLKKQYLSYSRSEQEVALMRCIKKALDPNNCLNPGKIFD